MGRAGGETAHEEEQSERARARAVLTVEMKEVSPQCRPSPAAVVVAWWEAADGPALPSISAQGKERSAADLSLPALLGYQVTAPGLPIDHCTKFLLQYNHCDRISAGCRNWPIGPDHSSTSQC